MKDSISGERVHFTPDGLNAVFGGPVMWAFCHNLECNMCAAVLQWQRDNQDKVIASLSYESGERTQHDQQDEV